MITSNRQASTTKAPITLGSVAHNHKQQMQEILWLAAIFALAMSLRLWFNFASPHINSYDACDAWEYLNNAGEILKLSHLPVSFWQDCLAVLCGQATAATVTAVHLKLQALADLSMSGPTYPLFLALCYSIAHTPFDPGNWSVPVIWQSLLSSLTCLAVYGAGKRAWGQSTGIIAGFLCALYPGFIINSGRLVTETLACFLLTMATWHIVRGLSSAKQSRWELFFLGTICGALQLTRTVLTLVSPLMMPVALTQPTRARKISAFLCLFVGLFISLCPWAAWQWLTTGHASLIVDRVSSYNMRIGNDPFTGGWVSIPLQTLDGAEKQSLSSLAIATITRNPVGFARLCLDKIARLFKLPFNDFRSPIGPLDAGALAIFHQLLLMLACCGIICTFSLGSSTHEPERKVTWCRTVLLWAIVIHLAYLPFVAVARYALTAMPFVILFAGAGLESLYRLSSPYGRRQVFLLACCLCLSLLSLRSNLIAYCLALFGPDKGSIALVASCLVKSLAFAGFLAAAWNCQRLLAGNHKMSKALTIALAGIILPVACWQSRAQGRWYEWQSEITKSAEHISETIILPAPLGTQAQKRQCYLLVDADGWQNFFPGAQLQVNGKTFTSTAIPGLSMPDCVFWYTTAGDCGVTRTYEQVMSSLALAAGLTLPDLRQWFLMPLPADAIKNGRLQIDVANAGDTPLGVYGTYATRASNLQIPDVYNYSWDKAFYGVENEKGLSDTRLDQVIPRITCPAQKQDMSSKAGLQCGNWNIRLLVAPPSSNAGDQHNKTIFAAELENQTVSANGSHEQSVPLPSGLAKSTSGLWLVRLCGQATVGRQVATPSIALVLRSRDSAGKVHRYLSPWTPTISPCRVRTIPFDLSFPVNPKYFPGKIEAIDLLFYADHPLIASKRIGQRLAGQASFSLLKLQVSDMPVLPVDRGYTTF